MNTSKSPGHVGFWKLPYSEPVEVYKFDGGDGESVCVATVSNVIDVDTGYRLGRFECYGHGLPRLLENWRQLGGKEVTL